MARSHSLLLPFGKMMSPADAELPEPSEPRKELSS